MHRPFLTPRWNSNLSCLEVTKESTREHWLLQQNLHAHKSSVWLNRCQVSLRRTLRIFRWEYLKPAQNKYLWSINIHRHIPSPSFTEQKLPLQSVLQHVRHTDKASRSCGFFSALHSKAMFFIPAPLIFIPPFLLHLMPQARGLSAVSSYWKHASLFGLKGQSQPVCTKSLMQKSLCIS